MCYRTTFGGKGPDEEERKGVTCCRKQDEIEEAHLRSEEARLRLKEKKRMEKYELLVYKAVVAAIIVIALLGSIAMIIHLIKSIAEAQLYWKAASIGIEDIKSLVDILSKNNGTL